METDLAFDSIGFYDSIKRLILCVSSFRFCLSFFSLILSATIDSYGSVLWSEIASYYYKNRTSSIVPFTLLYKIMTNVVGRISIGVILKKYDSIVCLLHLNYVRIILILFLYLFNEQFSIFFICIGGIFFCSGSRIVSSVLLSNKLFGKVNAQLLVP